MYLLTSVSGYWVINDSQVTVSSASLIYGCSDLSISQSNFTNPLSVSNHFSRNTGFTTYVSEAYGVMGAKLTVNYKMGNTRSWSFTLDNTLFNNPGFDFSGRS